MNSFKFIGLASVALIGCAAARADNVQPLPADQPVVVNGLDLVCTGVGEDARNDPRWTAYPVRIEFANADAQYLSDVVLRVNMMIAECFCSRNVKFLPPQLLKKTLCVPNPAKRKSFLFFEFTQRILRLCIKIL